MAKLIRFFKPFRVLSQFTDTEGRATLADFIDVPDVYTAGRLDYDSEGLLLLTDDGALQARIAHPKHKLEKVYAAQVEGTPAQATLDRLVQGVALRDGLSRAVSAKPTTEPARLPPRDPSRSTASSRVEQLGQRRSRHRQEQTGTSDAGGRRSSCLTSGENQNRTVEARRSGAGAMESGSGAPAALMCAASPANRSSADGRRRSTRSTANRKATLRASRTPPRSSTNR